MAMTFLEYLDRVGDRRAAKRPRDIRQFIGFAFLAGYYVMVYQFTRTELPATTVDLIRDAMLTLGPPIGIIIGAMFRTDSNDERRVDNTSKALTAITETAKAATASATSGAPLDVTVVNQPSEPVPTTTAGKSKEK